MSPSSVQRAAHIGGEQVPPATSVVVVNSTRSPSTSYQPAQLVPNFSVASGFTCGILLVAPLPPDERVGVDARVHLGVVARHSGGQQLLDGLRSTGRSPAAGHPGSPGPVRGSSDGRRFSSPGWYAHPSGTRGERLGDRICDQLLDPRQRARLVRVGAQPLVDRFHGRPQHGQLLRLGV